MGCRSVPCEDSLPLSLSLLLNPYQPLSSSLWEKPFQNINWIMSFSCLKYFSGPLQTVSKIQTSSHDFQESLPSTPACLSNLSHASDVLLCPALHLVPFTTFIRFMSGGAGSLLPCRLFCSCWVSVAVQAFLQLRRAGLHAGCGARSRGGFSCCKAQTLGHVGTGPWGTGSVVAVIQARWLRGAWDLPGSGIKPVPPALAGGLLTTEPPGKPYVRCHLVSSIALRQTGLLSFLMCAGFPAPLMPQGLCVTAFSLPDHLPWSWPLPVILPLHLIYLFQSL